MYHNTHYEDYNLQNVIPNSRIVPPIPAYNNNITKTNDYWRQPARTTSLQRQEHYFKRESFIDPASQFQYLTEPIEDNHLIKDVYSQTKDIKSNIQHVPHSPIQVQHGFVNPPQPSVAVIENNTSTIPRSSRRQPPLPPLVIPPTPTRILVTTPTRTPSVNKDTMPIGLHTPGGLSTPGSCRSINTQDSPYIPSPQHMIPSPLAEHKSKKQSYLPESEAERLLQQGIKCHEAGRLEQATQLFKQASNLDLPIAMFLYGISLRHGWGCVKNEYLAFQYLQKSAEHAVEDLTNLSSTVNMSAAKSELIMAIYELGVSFRHGWGCKKNKETAVYYFKIAADLNDPDAQNDLGHCYYHGHGVKKDLYMAAKYYRRADKQGHGIMGNSWIWKSKYDNKKII